MNIGGSSEPACSLVDGPQALLLSELSQFLEDIQITHKAYENREALAKRYRNIQQVS
jgi:3-deoxy-7-phosphoheptulonate synthase